MALIRLLGVASLVSALLLAGCTGHADDSGTVLVAGTSTIGPSDTPAWLADGMVYYLAAVGGESDSPLHLYRTPADGKGKAREIHLSGVTFCRIPYLTSLRRLPDGGLGAVLVCAQEDGSATLVSIDPASGRVAKISGLYGGDDGIWSTAENKGWSAYSQDGCASIEPIDRKGWSAVPPLEPASLLPWDLDADFAAGAGDCTPRGMIGFPAAAPTMDRIVVLASPEAAGVDPGDLGDGRKDLPWHLYGIDLASRQIRQIGGSFVEPKGIAVAGDTALVTARQGLYAVDLASGATRTIAEGDFGAPGLSPDGRSAVFVKFPDPGYPKLLKREIS
jgi:hypothetical protein